jgi:hypothetical protein
MVHLSNMDRKAYAIFSTAFSSILHAGESSASLLEICLITKLSQNNHTSLAQAYQRCVSEGQTQQTGNRHTPQFRHQQCNTPSKTGQVSFTTASTEPRGLHIRKEYNSCGATVHTIGRNLFINLRTNLGSSSEVCPVSAPMVLTDKKMLK